MARKAYSEEDRVQVRNALMTTMIQCIADRGLIHSSIDVLCRKVGISKTFFYSFFSSKEELVLYALRYQQPKLLDYARSLMEDPGLSWRAGVETFLKNCCYDNRRFSSYWNSDNNMTYPLILAKIPVKNPWEIFAYLPFGGWNECPNTPELMAVAKYWFEQHGAVPAAMSHDELEFLLPAPVSEKEAIDVAVELYGFCPDVIDQGPEDATVGALADVLRQSTVWYFWWD